MKLHKIKSLKTRIYKIEKLLEKLRRKSSHRVKCFFKDWVGWWANKFNIGGKNNARSYKKKNGWWQKNEWFLHSTKENEQAKRWQKKEKKRLIGQNTLLQQWPCVLGARHTGQNKRQMCVVGEANTRSNRWESMWPVCGYILTPVAIDSANYIID